MLSPVQSGGTKARAEEPDLLQFDPGRQNPRLSACLFRALVDRGRRWFTLCSLPSTTPSSSPCCIYLTSRLSSTRLYIIHCDHAFYQACMGAAQRCVRLSEHSGANSQLRQTSPAETRANDSQYSHATYTLTAHGLQPEASTRKCGYGAPSRS